MRRETYSEGTLNLQLVSVGPAVPFLLLFLRWCPPCRYPTCLSWGDKGMLCTPGAPHSSLLCVPAIGASWWADQALGESLMLGIKPPAQAAQTWFLGQRAHMVPLLLAAPRPRPSGHTQLSVSCWLDCFDVSLIQSLWCILFSKAMGPSERPSVFASQRSCSRVRLVSSCELPVLRGAQCSAGAAAGGEQCCSAKLCELGWVNQLLRAFPRAVGGTSSKHPHERGEVGKSRVQAMKLWSLFLPPTPAAAVYESHT